MESISLPMKSESSLWLALTKRMLQKWQRAARESASLFLSCQSNAPKLPFKKVGLDYRRKRVQVEKHQCASAHSTNSEIHERGHFGSSSHSQTSINEPRWNLNWKVPESWKILTGFVFSQWVLRWYVSQ